MQMMAFGDIFFAGCIIVWVFNTERGASVWLRVTVLQSPLSLPSQSLQSPRLSLQEWAFLEVPTFSLFLLDANI